VRVNALVSGGLLPESMAGQVLGRDLVHIADWYATFAELAGADAQDPAAAAAGLPGVDSVSQWGLLNGTVAQGEGPRSEVHLSANGLISGQYKVLTGKQPMTGWTGVQYPNNTGQQPVEYPGLNIMGWEYDCDKAGGCLYDIFADETEHVNLAQSKPAVLANLTARLAVLNQGIFTPDRGSPDRAACKAAQANGGFYGPFVVL
jgi:arylsulfatase I/J